MQETAAHSPTPWFDNDNGLIYATSSECQDEAPFVADVIADRERQSFGIMTVAERANVAFIVRACNAHHDMLEALENALIALRREYDEASDCIKDAVAAIAKAKGGAA